jgi:hypothetical protein
MKETNALRGSNSYPDESPLSNRLRNTIGVLLLALPTGCATTNLQTSQIPTIYIPAVDNSSSQASAKVEPEIEKKENRDCLPASKISFLKARDYHEKVAAVQDETGWYFIDLSGNPVSDVHFDYAESFENGKAAVNKNGELFYVDHQMRRVERPEEEPTDADVNTLKFAGQFDRVGHFNDGLAEARNGSNLYFIDEKGAIAFQEDPRWIYSDFSEGSMAILRRQDDQFTYLDKTGHIMYQETFDSANNFREGLAAVCQKKEWFHIKMDGNPAYTARYNYVRDFNGGLAVAQTDDRWFHIKMDGNPAYTARYNYVRDFNGGLAVAQTDDRWFHIGKSGKPYPDRTKCAE